MRSLAVSTVSCLLLSLAISPGAAQEPAPPQAIFGHYGRWVEVCYMPSKDGGPLECDKQKAHDTLVITRKTGNSLHIALDLHFFNGHTCSFDGPAKWAGGQLELIDSNTDGTPDDCFMRLHVTGETITLHDVSRKCTQGYCGTRGMLDGVTLPREE